MPTPHIISTDSPKKIKLDSSVIYARWLSTLAVGGGTAKVEARTSFVGEGATIEIKAKTEEGIKCGKLKEKMYGNRFVGEVEISDKVIEGDKAYFEVKLPKHGLNAESNYIPCIPEIICTRMQWSQQEARRGDVLTLSAEFENIGDKIDASAIIYEFDQDGNHDKVATIPTVIENRKLNLKWKFEYHEDTDEIATEGERQIYGKNYNPPEYFFEVDIGGLRLGTEQESGILKFKDKANIHVLDGFGRPAANRDVVLFLADGTNKTVQTDKDGNVIENSLPPGKISIEVKPPK